MRRINVIDKLIELYCNKTGQISDNINIDYSSTTHPADVILHISRIGIMDRCVIEETKEYTIVKFKHW